MNDLGLDVGQANELKLAMRRFDWSNALIKRLCEKDCNVLGDALDLLRGDKRLVPVKRVVDCSANPVLAEGETIVRHVRHGKLEWDKLKLGLLKPERDLPGWEPYVSSSAKLINRRRMVPKYLSGYQMPNIIIRDYLLEYPHLIPESLLWTSSPVLFWGTVVRGSRGTMYVPGIQCYSKWEKYDRVVNELGDSAVMPYNNPAAILVK